MTLRAQFRNLIFGNPLYRLTLTRSAPKTVLGTPPDPWPGNVGIAEALIASPFMFGGAPAESGPWFTVKDDDEAGSVRHGFAWLRDLRTQGSDEARQRGRALVSSWIAAHGRWTPLAWRPDVLGERVAHWLVAFGYLTTGADEAFGKAMLASLAGQAQHLRRVFATAEPDIRLLTAIKGLIYAGICLSDGDRDCAFGLANLVRELERQVLPDGGHIQRSPSIHMEVLRLLIDIRGALAAAHREVPMTLQSAIDRMAPLLRTFRHGDGRLALFNGSAEDDDKDVSMTLAQSGSRGRALLSAPHSGFQRLNAGRTLILADVGSPPGPGADRRAQAGTLSFEMSVGRDRLVVNCGAAAGGESAWHQALAATAAHSTLAVNDTNSSEVRIDGGLGRRPFNVACTRREEDGNVLLELSHDGYAATAGLTHHRQLYLSADGSDFRGQDRLDGTAGGSFAVRFHLHPQIQSSLIEGGSQVLLKLPAGGGWRFLCAGAKLALDDSIYAGSGRGIRRCRQIVLSGAIEPGQTIIKWAFHRETG
jgi:uncharacterized heparinase superfamily protein